MTHATYDRQSSMAGRSYGPLGDSTGLPLCWPRQASQVYDLRVCPPLPGGRRLPRVLLNVWLAECQSSI
jgi:hypothetical protein